MTWKVREVNSRRPAGTLHMGQTDRPTDRQTDRQSAKTCLVACEYWTTTAPLSECLRLFFLRTYSWVLFRVFHSSVQ